MSCLVAAIDSCDRFPGLDKQDHIHKAVEACGKMEHVFCAVAGSCEIFTCGATARWNKKKGYKGLEKS